MYLDINDISKVSFGRRTTVYPGMANLREILEEEIEKHSAKTDEVQDSSHEVPEAEDGPTSHGKTLVSGKSKHHARLAKLRRIQSIRISADPRFSANAGAKASGRQG